MDSGHNVRIHVYARFVTKSQLYSREVLERVPTDTYARVMAHVRPTRVRQQQLEDLNRATQGRIHPFIARSYFLPGT